MQVQSGRISNLSLLRARRVDHAEADGFEPLGRADAEAGGRARRGRRVAERAAADYPLVAVEQAGRVVPPGVPVRPGLVPVAAPLAEVAVHVVQAEPVGLGLP